MILHPRFLMAIGALFLTLALLPPAALATTPGSQTQKEEAKSTEDSKESSSSTPSEPTSSDSGPTSEPNRQTRRAFGPEHRREIYETSRLQNRTALLYTAALPGLGNFYAEQYAAGVISMAGLAFSIIFLSYGLTNNQTDVVRLGLGLAAVTYLGSGATALYGVHAYNAQLRRSLHLDASLPAGPGLTLQWSFEF